MGLQEIDPLAQLNLPPGFRFCPTDEELLVQYLWRKVAGQQFSLQIIGDIDLYKFDPWVLPGKAIFGEKEWYFFSPREKKYPNGSRPNRIAGSGYWKATGTDKTIKTEGCNVGIKKSLVFYIGKAPKGTKTNWIMHEYRLLDSSKWDDWVLCRIYKKNFGDQKLTSRHTSKEYSTNGSSSSSLSQTHLNDVMNSLPKIEDRLFSLPQVNSMETLHQEDKNNLNNLDSESLDWTSIAKLSSMYDVIPNEYSEGQNTQGCVTFANNAINTNMYMAAPGSHVETLVKRIGPVKEEVQSGLQSHQVDNSSYFQKNN